MQGHVPSANEMPALEVLPSGFGAVTFISSIEMKELPSLYAGGPPSISQDDGVPTLLTGNLVF
jgi:hypothetical protein